METLLKFIVSSIVENPKAVKVKKIDEENFTNLQLQVDPEDLKIVIGKKGRTIKAIRNLIRLRAMKEGVRVNLELLENQ